jgi:hypothetical protein
MEVRDGERDFGVADAEDRTSPVALHLSEWKGNGGSSAEASYLNRDGRGV